MKKSKFLLLGSVASLASIPFVAAKCGETKEEKKPEEGKNPGQNTEPGKNPGGDKNPGENTDQDKNPGGDKNPGENTDQDKNPGGDKNPGTDKKPEGEKKPDENKTPEEDKEPSDEELSEEFSKEKIEGELTEDEEKLIDKNLYNGLTQDENHIWGVDDDQGSRTNSGTKVQNPGDKSGTTTQPSDTTKPDKPANNPMVRTDGNISENSEANDDIRWKGITAEDKKRAKESGEFWAEYWGLK